MITINAIIKEDFGHPVPVIKIISRIDPNSYKSLTWPVGEPLTSETIKAEVAKQWETDPSQVTILDNVEIPEI